MRNFACAPPHPTAQSHKSLECTHIYTCTSARTGDLKKIDEEIKEEKDRKKDKGAELKKEQGGLKGYVPKGKKIAKDKEVGADIRSKLRVLRTDQKEAQPQRALHPKVN